MRAKQIKDVTAYLRDECPTVTDNLIIHVGTNNLQRNPSSTNRMITGIQREFEELVQTFQRTMPSSCQLTISGITQRNDIDWQTVEEINSWLESLASQNSRVSFSHSERIDNHSESLLDGLHLTDIGTRILCKKFINIIKPWRNQYNQNNQYYN